MAGGGWRLFCPGALAEGFNSSEFRFGVFRGLRRGGGALRAESRITPTKIQGGAAEVNTPASFPTLSHNFGKPRSKRRGGAGENRFIPFGRIIVRKAGLEVDFSRSGEFY